MRVLVAIGVLAVGIGAAGWVLAVTGMTLIQYMLLVIGVALTAPYTVRRWASRHPGRCAHCHGRGTTTFVAAQRLRTRRCFFCDGTGRLGHPS